MLWKGVRCKRNVSVWCPVWSTMWIASEAMHRLANVIVKSLESSIVRRSLCLTSMLNWWLLFRSTFSIRALHWSFGLQKQSGTKKRQSNLNEWSSTGHSYKLVVRSVLASSLLASDDTDQDYDQSWWVVTKAIEHQLPGKILIISSHFLIFRGALFIGNKN